MSTIAYLGPEKTHTHAAAKARFGGRASYLHAPTVDDVFELVERRKADYGVVPIENSLEGAVARTLDRFIDFVDTPVTIHGELEQPIHNYLILARETKLSDVLQVFSHPQALAQSHRWLAKHLPRAALRETNSTTDAVSYVLEQKKLRAAIGRKELAEFHSRLRAIAITDERENKTRFLVIGLGQPPKGRANKTSILFGVKDRPGALYDALVPFKRHQINLTKIESRPSRRKAWEYLFFIDVEGHSSDANVKRALQGLSRSTSFLRVLGSYPLGHA